MTKHTINITPDWTAAGKMLALAIRHGTPEGRELAAQEVERMGALLDMLGEEPACTQAEEGPGWVECDTVSDSQRKAYISDVPEGYDTVLGYIARYEPWSLDFDLWDAEATQRDGFWLMHRSSERGIEVKRVAAPQVLQQQDIYVVNAYPVSLLAERLGG